LLFTEAKPLLLAKPAKPPDAGALDGELDAALPKGLVLLLFAKLENPDCPKAGVTADAPPDADAQGELFAPSWDDCPKPMELGLPNAGAEVAAVLLKPLEPNTAPPVLGAAEPVLAPPHGDDFCPSCEAEPNAEGVGLEKGDAEAAGPAWVAGAGVGADVPSTAAK